MGDQDIQKAQPTDVIGTVPPAKVATVDVTDYGNKDVFSVEFSNSIRLTGRQWLCVALFAVLLVVFAPTLWKMAEPFPLETDYRMPHDLGNDYWLYERYVDQAAGHYDSMLIGDSVIWGEYVT